MATGAVVMLGALAGAPLQAVALRPPALRPLVLRASALQAAALETGTPESSGGAACPSPNPPNEMTLVAGTPQTALVETAFATGLQVALANSDGCPVTGAAGVPVTFSAPPSGASGVFSTTASDAALVGADATGAVSAPPLTANTLAGSYTVTASSRYGSVSFSLTNASAGVWCPALDRRVSTSGEPVKLVAGAGSTQSASAGARFPIRLAVTVTDAAGNPVAGVLVTFSAPRTGASGRFTVNARDPHRRARGSHLHTVKVKTDACGIAVAPAFTADEVPGGYVVTAGVGNARPAAFALVNEARGQSS